MRTVVSIAMRSSRRAVEYQTGDRGLELPDVRVLR
jgi:hypothetical protein